MGAGQENAISLYVGKVRHHNIQDDPICPKASDNSISWVAQRPGSPLILAIGETSRFLVARFLGKAIWGLS